MAVRPVLKACSSFVAPPVIPHKTKVHYPAGLSGRMYGMFATSRIEKRAAVKLRMTPTEEPSSKVVCLVDDDPLMLRSISNCIGKDGL